MMMFKALEALEDALCDVAAAVEEIDSVPDGWRALQELQRLLGRNGTATDIRQAIENRTGDLFETDTVMVETVDGRETLIVRRRPGRQEWHDEDRLFGLVRDSTVFTVTGEKLTPLDAILLAYGSVNRKTGLRRLASPKKTGLDALGIDAKDFSEWRPTRQGWEIGEPR